MQRIQDLLLLHYIKTNQRFSFDLLEKMLKRVLEVQIQNMQHSQINARSHANKPQIIYKYKQNI